MKAFMEILELLLVIVVAVGALGVIFQRHVHDYIMRKTVGNETLADKFEPK